MKTHTAAFAVPSPQASASASAWTPNLRMARLGLDVVVSVCIPCWGWLGGVAMMGRGDLLRGNLMVLSGIAGLFAYLCLMPSP